MKNYCWSGGQTPELAAHTYGTASFSFVSDPCFAVITNLPCLSASFSDLTDIPTQCVKICEVGAGLCVPTSASSQVSAYAHACAPEQRAPNRTFVASVCPLQGALR